LLCAADGASGVSMAMARLPDVVLIDLQLPDFDGLEVLRRLKASSTTNELRFVALSANAMPEDIAQALAAGFDDYWTKPVDMKKVLEKLDAWCLR
jgi:CheY-like chemotaxis protein